MMEQQGLFAAPAPAEGDKSTRTAGPKARAEMSSIPWDHSLKGSQSLDWFARKYLIVPRGKGSGGPMELRRWQLDMSGTLYHDDTSLAVWVLPRGQGKSGIAAAIALHFLFKPGRLGTRIAIVAQDERSARRLLATAVRMIGLNPELDSRATVYRDRVVIPATDAELVALPAEAHRVEGADLDLAILDEIGFMPAATFEAAVLSTGKVEGGKVLCIGTPSPSKFKEISPLWNLVIRGRAAPHNKEMQLVEYGSPPSWDIYDPKTWARANPAYGDWLTEKTISAQSPPTTRELEFRRARLGQWVESSSEPAFNPEAWKVCARTGVRIPPGEKVVLALDGSMNGDSTAILVGSVSAKPHYQIGGLWEPSKEGEDYEVSHLEVEQRVRDLANIYRIVEVVADPFRWQRSLQVLDEEGYPVAKFPHTAQRLTPATNDLRAAVNNRLITHGDQEKFNSHVLRASVEETTRGLKLAKPSRNEKIDLAACLVMAHSRCSWLGSKKNSRRRKVKGYKA